MGDNGFHEWFRDFAKETFLEVFGPVNKTSAPESSTPPCRHQWLRPDNGVIECATCGATQLHYGD